MGPTGGLVHVRCPRMRDGGWGGGQASLARPLFGPGPHSEIGRPGRAKAVRRSAIKAVNSAAF